MNHNLKTLKVLILVLSTFFSYTSLFSQEEDLLSDIIDSTSEVVTNEFKTSQVINLQTLMMTAPGEFDFKINHRFESLTKGLYDAFGLDGAIIRIGGEYGITNNLVFGLGRSGYQKTSDAFLKYKILSQKSNKKSSFNLGVMLASSYLHDKNLSVLVLQSGKKVNFVTRLNYTSQIIISKKFTENFTLQLSPSYVHYNLSETKTDNGLFALGLATRYKFSRSSTLNLEYIPVLVGSTQYYNSISVGVDIETGGHVFQLHLSNSQGMAPNQFIARNALSNGKQNIYFGFNIARTFNIINK